MKTPERPTDAPPAAAPQAPPTPAPAGSAGVLVQLKRFYGMLPDADTAPAPPIEPDLFPLAGDSPLRPGHEMLTAVLWERVEAERNQTSDLSRLEARRALLALEPGAMGRAVLAAAERHIHALLAPHVPREATAVWRSRTMTAWTMGDLLKSHFELRRDGIFDLLLYLSSHRMGERTGLEKLVRSVMEQAEGEAARSSLSEGERYVLALFRKATMSGPGLRSTPEEVQRLTRLIGDDVVIYLASGEVWTDAVNDDLAAVEAARRVHWVKLLDHALTATAAKPSAKWLKEARQLAGAIGGEDVREKLLRWFPLFGSGRTIGRLPHTPNFSFGTEDVPTDEDAACLRGLVWLTQVLPRRDELTRAITAVALSAYKKVPRIGPRAVRVGNAAVYALSEMGSTDAVGQLAILKVRVKSVMAQKEIEKAFNASAEALGLPRDQVEEMGVPSYGLEEVGLRRESFGEHRAELVVTGSDAELSWFDAKGKALKSVPARVKADHKDELKELQQSLKDVQSMLPAQRDRLDAMFLLRKTWPIAEWRERYLDHPLVGTIARRLIWCVDGTPAFFRDGRATDVAGDPIEHGETAEVRLWHPVGRGVDEVVAWRRRLEELGITQPFKQAHREVYLLTDAERNTRTYSNRFAAHIIRQHQFNALCAARGWKNRLRLMVDEHLPAGDARAAGPGPARRVLGRRRRRRPRDRYQRGGGLSQAGDRPGPVLPDRGGREPGAGGRRRLHDPRHGTRRGSRQRADPARAGSRAGLLGGHARRRPVRRRRLGGQRPDLAGRRARGPIPAVLERLLLRRAVGHGGDPQAGPRAAGPAAQDRRPVLVLGSLPGREGPEADVQDPPGIGQHPDGAQRRVSLHRPGLRGRGRARATCSCPSRGTARCRSSSARRSCWPPTTGSRTLRSRDRSIGRDPGEPARTQPD